MQPETTRLEHLAVLEISGADADRFLQSQLTADVAALGQGEAGFAACCNPAGRVLGVLLLRRTALGFMALCAAELVTPLTEWLRRFVLRAKVNLAPRPDLAVYMGHSESAGLLDFPTRHGLYQVAAVDVAPADDGRWRRKEIETGLVWLDTACSGAFLPQMIGMERLGALSFRKGCYPGQEIIARARHLGQLKRHPLVCALPACSSLAPMQSVELTSASGAKGSAVVVSSETFPAGGVLAFLVARLDPVQRVVQVGAEGDCWTVERSEWLTGAA